MKAVLLMILLFFVSGQGYAQSVCLTMHGGAAFPAMPDEFTDYWFIGYNAGLGVSYHVASFLEVRGLVEYGEFQLDEAAILKDADVPVGLVRVTGGAVSAIMITGNLKLFPFPAAGTIRPYAIIGGGLGAFEVGDVTVSALGISETVSGSSEKAAVALGGIGVDFVVSPSFDMFFEGRYMYAFTEDEHITYVPATMGLRIKF